MNPITSEKVETISFEYFKDNFQEVWSQCGRGRTYQIEGEFEVVEMKNIGVPKRELQKPVWPPTDLSYAVEPSCDI
jgi:hypothetical protein